MNRVLFDFFDKLLTFPIFRLFKPLYKKYEKFWVYCFLGFCSTIINIFFYSFFTSILSIDKLIGNILAWLVGGVLSFAIYRYLYFDKTNNSFINELIKFYTGRLVSLLVEELSVFIFIVKLCYNDILIKVLTKIVTAIFNYFFSKLIVFTTRKKAA